MDVYHNLRHPLALAMFSFTLLLPVLVGLLALRRTRDQADFFVGGMAMNRFVVALSAVSSGRSSWLVMGLCGMAYTMGTGAVWAVMGYVVVEMLQFVYLGRRLREAAQQYGAITLLDFLEARFPGGARHVRWVGALIMVLFITAYVTAQLNAGGIALGGALGLSKAQALVAAAALILVYMVLGGFVAVAYNDVVRSVIMLVGLVLLPVVAVAHVGGIKALFSSLAAIAPSAMDPFSVGAGAMAGFLGIGLGSPGQPHILVRYMSIDDPEQLRMSAVVGTVWNVLLGWGALWVGLAGRVTLPQASALPQGKSEMIYLALSAQHFGPLFYGLLVGGVFAAILSTADSQLLVVASTVVRDIYEALLLRGKKVPEARKLLLSRMVVVVAGMVSVVLAYYAEDLIFWLVLFAWGGLGAAFGPAVLLSLYDRATSRAGVAAGMLVGTVVVIVWRLWLKKPTGVYELIPAFALATLAVVVVSRLLPDPRRDDD